MWRMLTVLSLSFFGLSSQARGQSHSYTNQMRSGDLTYVFFQQSIDGEFGSQKTTVPTVEEGSPSAKPKVQSKAWRGFGLSSSVGMEILRFLHFQVGHTFVNLTGQDDGLSSLAGSRLHAGGRAVFTAPVANLELGAGVLGSRLDYRQEMNSTSLYGSGSYASIGLSYFVTPQVSIYGEGRMVREHLVRSGGSPLSSAIDTDMTSAGMGFRIWL